MDHRYEIMYFVKKTANSSWRLQDSVLNYCDLTFILEGDATYTAAGQACFLTAGEAVFLPAGSERYAQTNGMHCVAFNFFAAEPLFKSMTKIPWHNDPALLAYFQEFNQAWNTKTDLDKLRCDGLFLLILSRLLELQRARQSNPSVLRIKDYLHKHYTCRFTVRQVAEQVGLSPVYCGALFAKECGETILNYTNRLRVIRAKELLQCTVDPVSQIAADAGFESLYYFSRVFKQFTGLSPQQYRLSR